MSGGRASPTPGQQAGDPPRKQAGDPPRKQAGDPPRKQAGDPPREIERQFLCAGVDPEALRRADARLEITQSYLAVGDPSVRIRRIDDSWRLGVKAGRGLVRDEVEVDVPPEAGAHLERIAGSRRVRKVRHRRGRWELDVFTGDLDGLVIAEVELEREDEPLPPVPDGVAIVREITGEERFTNQRLAALPPEGRAALLAAVEREVRRFRARAGEPPAGVARPTPPEAGSG